MAYAARPILSIITPVRNARKYVASCIESVAAQDCPEVEHIIVDGASTDGTTAIVSEHAKARPGLRFIAEPDKGQSDAQNKGIRAAKADYVGILNVDDFYAPGALRRVVEIIRGLREPRFIHGNCNVLSEGDGLARINRPFLLKFENVVVDREAWPFPHNPSSYFYPKRLHEEVGYYDVDEHFAMDLKFVLAAIQVIEPLYIDEVLGNFRLVPGTKTFATVVDGTSEIRQRRIMFDAFLRAPLHTKLRVASVMVSRKSRVAYWHLHGRMTRGLGKRHGSAPR